MKRVHASAAIAAGSCSAWLERLPLRGLVIGVGVVSALVVVDAFHASELLGRWRAALFWAALVGLNVAGWKVWRGLTGAEATSRVRLLVGGVLLNGLLAVEVAALFRLMGRSDATLQWQPFLYGLLVTGFLIYLQRRRGSQVAPSEDASGSVHGTSQQELEVSMPLPVASASPFLKRAGLADAAGLTSIRAEDHYCRLLLADGTSRLVLYRFKDAIAELREVDGEQVHRGAWVAGQSVVGGRREGRRWALNLADGTTVPVSETSVALCRARGWLRSPDDLA